MALLDVSEVLTDPDFIDKIPLRRNAMAANASGLGISTPTPSNIWGVVTNADGDVLNRQRDGEIVNGSITVHTKAILIAGDENNTADILIWRKREYTVSSVSDWSNFGQGFSAAVCDLKPLTG